MSEKIIQMEKVSKWFGDFQALKDIDLEVAQKQKIVVCGPSGSGKSTLIRCINRLEEHQQGKIVIDGIELSVFVLTDGENYKILPEAKDYKRIGEQDTGLNTGGMGAVTPIPFANEEFLSKVEERVVKPTVNGLKSENIDYKGFIFIGLMNVGGDPYVIEYNVRMGDPETQVVLPKIKSDLVDLLEATAKGTLGDIDYTTHPEAFTTVVMVSGGYPGSYPKGLAISGIDTVDTATVFHAGTKLDDSNTVLTNGGRVLAITGKADSVEKALENAYNGVNKISWQDEYHRKDIGQDILRLINN